MRKPKNSAPTADDLPPQLTRLGQVRHIVSQVDAEHGRPADKFSWCERDELVERISRALGLSPRSVARYLAALRTPDEVQQALDEGRLKLVEVQRIAGLRPPVQAAIAQRLAAGERGSDVLRDFVPADSNNETRRAFTRFYSSLSRELPRLADRVDDIPLRPLCRWAGLLAKTRDLLDSMIAKVEAVGGGEAVTDDVVAAFVASERDAWQE